MREERGQGEEEIETQAESALDLYTELRERHGFSLEPDRLKVVVNEEFTEWPHRLSDGDTVVFLPPVAGGSPSTEGETPCFP